MNIKRIGQLLVMIGVASSAVNAFAPNNFFPPYDPNLRMPSWDDQNFYKKSAWRIGANFEAGSTGHSRSTESKRVNLLQMYDATQAAIPMLMGSNNKSTALFLQSLTAAYPGQPLDDGLRGHIKLEGVFEMYDATVHGRYWLPFDFIPGYVSLFVALPIRHMKLKIKKFNDLTANITAADRGIKQLLSSHEALSSKIKELGNLEIGDWSKTGVGDFVFMFEWLNSYRQERKESLKMVHLFAKLGVTAPTAEKKDEDKALSMSLGNDGAWGIPLGMGMALDFDYNIRLGLEAEFLVLFDETRIRRLKTDINQTEFLLLTKGDATKEHGLTWKFNLFWQWYHICRGLSFKAAYHYQKHDDDRYSSTTNDFSYAIINSAKSLQEWNMHHFIFQLNYDFFKEAKNFSIKPQLSFFYKLPVAGKGAIEPHTFGGQMAFNF